MENKQYFYRLSQYVLILSIFIILVGCEKDEPKDQFESLNILEKLKTLEGVTVTEITPSNGYFKEYQLDIVQPVDHNNPTGATFTQRAYLSHVDESLPLVFAPSGMWCGPSSSQEIALLLNTNCLHVTHRYYINAKPNPIEWSYLTVKQSADDCHRIVELFKKIYKGKWISSGRGKSGLSALIHRRFYPGDVDATIAYSVPFYSGVKDTRYPEYIKNIGGTECYPKLSQVQQYILRHRSEMLGILDTYINSGSSTFSIDRDLLLELCTLDYPSFFWQYSGYDCSSIPDTTQKTASEIFNHFSDVVSISLYSDANLVYYAPAKYQAVSELGAPAFETIHFSDLLIRIDPYSTGNPNYELLVPPGVSYTFNPNAMNDIYSWLQSNGSKIVYIYGKNDPQSAGAIELANGLDALLIMQEGANSNITIADIDDPEIVYNELERWLKFYINPTIW
ncbi:MAG: hypothetical protein KKG99_02225 [Bacteroidetes bacterium]|nr:hypothetical protein [Bacteroidota bacterium]